MEYLELNIKNMICETKTILQQTKVMIEDYSEN